MQTFALNSRSIRTLIDRIFMNGTKLRNVLRMLNFFLLTQMAINEHVFLTTECTENTDVFGLLRSKSYKIFKKILQIYFFPFFPRLPSQPFSKRQRFMFLFPSVAFFILS